MRSLTRTAPALLMLCICTFTTMHIGAQQPVKSAKQTSLVVARIARLKAGDKISVVLENGPEQYGRFKIADQDGFTFFDVDRNSDATLRYTDVKKVKYGYSGYNSSTGSHTDRDHALIAGGVIAGALVGLIVALVTAKN